MCVKGAGAKAVKNKVKSVKGAGNKAVSRMRVPKLCPTYKICVIGAGAKTVSFENTNQLKA